MAPLRYLLSPVKVSHSQMFLWITSTVFHCTKLLVVEGILYHTAVPNSYSSNA